MTDEKAKKVLVWGIKYAPIVLALTCSLKIMLLSMSGGIKDGYLYAVNWINWGLNIAALVVFYCMGVYFNFCWKHRSLCRTALWGYVFYAVFLIFDVPKEELRPITIAYVALVILMAGVYQFWKG